MHCSGGVSLWCSHSSSILYFVQVLCFSSFMYVVHCGSCLAFTLLCGVVLSHMVKVWLWVVQCMIYLIVRHIYLFLPLYPCGADICIHVGYLSCFWWFKYIAADCTLSSSLGFMFPCFSIM